MIYNTGEYNVQLDIPTENFVMHLFDSPATEYIDKYIHTVKQSIVNSDTLVILFGGFDNLREFDHWIKPLNDLAEQLPNPIIVFNGRLTADSNRTIEPKFAYHRIRMFEHVSNINLYYNVDIRVDKEHKFYWASSRDVYPRRYILAGLIKNNLIKENLVNYKCIHSQVPSDWLISRFDEKYIPVIEEECNSISHLVPLPALDDTIEFNLTDPKFYTNSYLGIITDTFYESGTFLSEKIFNAINYYQLFFYIGPAGTIEYLRKCGYHTFDSIIDTSYDSIVDNAERLFAARNSLLRFLNRPLDLIRDDYIKCIPSLQHNKELLSKQRPDLLITEYIQKLLNEHRKTNSNIS